MDLLSIPKGFSQDSKGGDSVPWPFLDQAVSLGHLDLIDCFIARRLLAATTCSLEEVGAFLALMIHDFRQGNIHFNIDLSGPEEKKELYLLAQKGESALPSELVTLIEAPAFFSKNQPLSILKPICKTPRGFYFQKNWLFETRTLHHISRLISRPFSRSSKHQNSQELNAEQRAAIDLSFKSSFLILTGGPGTGKTFTAKHLIKQHLQALSSQEKEKFRILLAAPTGKAVAHLQKQILPFLEPEEKHQVQSGTLHALLQLREDGSQKRETLLTCNLLLIDECSMIDAYLFQKLLDAIPSHTQLILLGDQNQLPAVGSGNFFADLIDANLPQVQLKTTCRTEDSDLKNLAKSIFSNDTAQLKTLLPSFQIPKEEKIYPSILKQIKTSSSHFFSSPPNTEEVLSSLHSFRILSCLRKGDLGVDTINQTILDSLEKELPSDGWWAIPIMITSNDYRSELYNGDVGVLVRKITDIHKHLPLGKEDYALFEGKEKISGFALPPFEYAYSLSVHKSQGSEYDEILLIIPEGSEKFGKEILYTAVTRAKKKIQIYLEEKTFQTMLEKSTKKRSNLTERILSEPT